MGEFPNMRKSPVELYMVSEGCSMLGGRDYSHVESLFCFISPQYPHDDWENCLSFAESPEIVQMFHRKTKESLQTHPGIPFFSGESTHQVLGKSVLRKGGNQTMVFFRGVNNQKMEVSVVNFPIQICKW
jgi:hypothetical protein